MAAFVLCLIMVMTSLTGCKYSSKLHELVQDRFNHLLDTKSAREFENDFDRVEKSDEITARERNRESKRKEDEEESKPVEGEERMPEDPAPPAESILSHTGKSEASASDKKNPKAVTSGNSSTADPAASAGRQASGSGSVSQGAGTAAGDSVSGGGGNGSSGNGGNGGNDGSGSGGSGSGGSEGSGADGNGEGGSGENGTEVIPDAGGSRQIWDADGNFVEIPEKVESVACTGPAAVFFCAAGGEGIIKASSRDFIDNYSQYNSEAASQIQPVWESGGTDFGALSSLAPEVYAEISGASALTSGQISELQANGTACITLPPPDSLEHIMEAMRIAGEITGDRSSSGGVDGTGLSSAYRSYVQNLSSQINAKASSSGRSRFADLAVSDDGYYNGKFSLFIKGWDQDASYSLGDLTGTGAAYTGRNDTAAGKLMTSLMSIGGVRNTVSKLDSENNNYSMKYVVPLGERSISLSIGSSSGIVAISSRGLHIAGYNSSNRLLEYTAGGSKKMLGAPDGCFPAIVTASRSAADSIKNDALWQTGYPVYFGGSMETNGFMVSESQAVGTSVAGDFQTLVSPSGLGSWFGGSPESILESAWIASEFYGEGAFSHSELVRLVQDFYSQFYRVSIDESQAESILAGE